MGFELLSLKILYIAMDKSATISKAAGAEGLASLFLEVVSFFYDKNPLTMKFYDKNPLVMLVVIN